VVKLREPDPFPPKKINGIFETPGVRGALCDCTVVSEMFEVRRVVNTPD
jgi:hypothetical protein